MFCFDFLTDLIRQDKCITFFVSCTRASYTVKAYGKTILKIVLPCSFTRCQPPLNISLRQIFSLSCVGTAPTTHTHYSRVIHTTRARGDNSCNCLTRVAHYLNLTDGHDNLIDCRPVCFSHRITKQYFVLVTLKPTPKT